MDPRQPSLGSMVPWEGRASTGTLTLQTRSQVKRRAGPFLVTQPNPSAPSGWADPGTPFWQIGPIAA